MKTMKAIVLAVLGLLVVPVALQAHHGTAGTYDQKKFMKLTGVVKQFRWRNPHCILIVTGKDSEGGEGDYAFEVGSPNSMIRRGLSRETFKVGDRISFDMHPAFANVHVGQPVNSTVLVNDKPIAGMAGGDE
jgi:Family of unknown function (DUF6152)